MDAQQTSGVTIEWISEACKTLDEFSEKIEALDKELSDIKRKKKEKSRELAKVFIEAGLQNQRFDGRTYYLHVDRFVRKTGGVSQGEACAALRKANMESFISESYNPAQVRACIKEAHDELPVGTPFEEALPTPLRSLFYVEEDAVLRSRA